MPADVPSLLKTEHGRLRTLCRRLKAACGGAGSGMSVVLDELLPFLFQHETWEEREFGAAWNEMASEHLTLRALAKDVQLVASHPELYAPEHLARLSGSLADRLSAHLEREEAALAQP